MVKLSEKDLEKWIHENKDNIVAVCNNCGGDFSESCNNCVNGNVLKKEDV
jgi:hypothetical protein